MTKLEILEMIANGEGSGVEFKEESVDTVGLAEEMVALANFKGGTILLGVTDDGSIAGVQRKDIEEWIMNVSRDIVKPGIIPYYEQIKMDEDRIISLIKIDQGLSKPYYVERRGRKKYMIRVGSTKREATRDELGRLFQEAGVVHYDVAPVYGTSPEDLDVEKLKEYFVDIRELTADEVERQMNQLLLNTELAVRKEDQVLPTVAGILLFGKEPHRVLRQSGITAVRFKGEEMDYEAEDRKNVRGTLPEQVNDALRFVSRNTKTSSVMNGTRREDLPEYPVSAVREAVVNAVVHRNYSIQGSEIRLFIFKDRLEVRSPGKLPNAASIEKIEVGCSAVRNPILVEFMQHYGYVEKTGLGIPLKIIRQMLQHNGKKPELVETDEEFCVTLFV
jgi:ATP-dependent DNA helicase RecG